MAVRRFLIPSLMAVAFLVPSGAQAFECPKHLTAAQAAIDKVVGDMKGMKMAQADRVLVHALLDDAKMMLAGAKHNHAKPQGAFDHGRSIAKAKAALGYAQGADIYHWKLMGKMKKMKMKMKMKK
ncbi:MAG: hypothetical protein O6831_13375 [Alphaproteobacteria bacterium]|nr:hypothetical protein [Alphaproteobacteria bacterium]